MENKKILSRRERERLRHREEILEAARRVFVANGYNSATMESIAAESEFSLATLYKFFGSKENLFVEILLEKLECMEQRTENILKDSGPIREKTIQLFKSRLDMYWENPGLMTLVDEAVTSNGVDLSCLEDLKRRYVTYVNSLKLFFSKGISEGVFRDLGAGNLAIAFEGMIEMFCGARDELKIKERNPQAEDNLLDLFFNGAAATLQKN